MRTQDRAALERFAADDALASLDWLGVPELSLFRALGVERDELAHSSLIATLFDPEKHRAAALFVARFVALLRTRTRAETSGAWHTALADHSWRVASVRREDCRIDVLVEIDTLTGPMAIGIENKIGAGEQEEQLARYQAELDRRHPGGRAVLVFLTPNGRVGTTVNAKSTVDCVAMSYDGLREAIDSTIGELPTEMREVAALRELSAHLKETIMENDDPEVVRLARHMWTEHRRAIELIVKHRPGLADIREAFERRVREHFGTDAEFDYYPRARGDLQEIKVRHRSWIEAGCPFTLLLYAKPSDGDPSPKVRLLLSIDHLAGREEALARWAREVNRSVPTPLLDETFASLNNWTHWRQVLAEDPYPSDAELDDLRFNDETAQRAFESVLALVAKLEGHVTGKAG